MHRSAEPSEIWVRWNLGMQTSEGFVPPLKKLHCSDFNDSPTAQPSFAVQKSNFSKTQYVMNIITDILIEIDDNVVLSTASPKILHDAFFDVLAYLQRFTFKAHLLQHLKEKPISGLYRLFHAHFGSTSAKNKSCYSS